MVTFITIFNLSGKLEVNFPQENMSVLLEDWVANIKRNVPLVRKMQKKKKKKKTRKKGMIMGNMKGFEVRKEWKMKEWKANTFPV